MKPPNVYEETIPSSHRIISRIKIVQSMEHLQILVLKSMSPEQLWDGVS
jgi:hypothetical protein